jgi:Mrp family chromosome partitioning ATPase
MDEPANPKQRAWCEEEFPSSRPLPVREDPVRQRQRKTVRMAAPSALVHVEQKPQPLMRPPHRPERPRPPRVSGWVDPRLVLLADPDSPRAAGFRLLCHNLVAKGLPRVVAVSSAAPHDGKTTCAVNLALALAERPARILLVEGNFYEPALAGIFAIEEKTPTPPSLAFPWLAPFKLAELSPCFHVAAIVGSEEERARIDKHAFEAMIGHLAQLGYDHLVVDAPALDGSAGVGKLIAAADGVLFAVRSGRTTARALRRAVEQLGSRTPLGAALMDG